MLVRSVEAVAFGTNCYVIAAEPGSGCVIIDPGIGVADRVAEVLRTDGLSPLAVLLTHGHLDHVYDVPSVTQPFPDALDQPSVLPSYIHSADRYRLINPLGDLDASFVAMLEAQFGQKAAWRQPAEVIEITMSTGEPSSATAQGATANGATSLSNATSPSSTTSLSIADLHFEVHHAPGHTEGSVLFSLVGVPEGLASQEPLDRTTLSGDVLFAGSIGRCDLPGGDAAAMTRSLREVVLPMPDSTLVLPGHGPATTMSTERAHNPYLRSLLV
ncbi:MAG: MBL fold metallo-hydrolase [Ornithinimicrobium sp.]